VGTDAKVTTINDARGTVGSSLTSVDLSGLTKLELSYALLIAVAAGGLVIGLGLNERRRSIAVTTLLGATRGQLRRLFGGEPVFVVVAGIGSGLLIGWGLAYLLVTVLTGVFDPPPSGLAVPWFYLTGLVVCATLAIGLAYVNVSRYARSHAREQLREI
jgi:putative ABC transport system permease protein